MPDDISTTVHVSHARLIANLVSWSPLEPRARTARSWSTQHTVVPGSGRLRTSKLDELIGKRSCWLLVVLWRSPMVSLTSTCCSGRTLLITGPCSSSQGRLQLRNREQLQRLRMRVSSWYLMGPDSRVPNPSGKSLFPNQVTGSQNVQRITLLNCSQF